MIVTANRDARNDAVTVMRDRGWCQREDMHVDYTDEAMKEMKERSTT